MRRISLAKGISIDFSSPLAKFIFEWFKQRSHPSTYLAGAQYTSLFPWSTSQFPGHKRAKHGRRQPENNRKHKVQQCSGVFAVFHQQQKTLQGEGRKRGESTKPARQQAGTQSR